MNVKEDKCPCFDTCPLENALKIIGGKWKMQIICSLYLDGPTRFNELKRKLSGVSNTMLSSALKELEDDGLVLREQFMEIPPRVEYSTTKSCDGLIPILSELAKWSINLK